jgi:hypothetical protein
MKGNIKNYKTIINKIMKIKIKYIKNCAEVFKNNSLKLN